MELNKKQLEFWAFIVIMALAASIAVLLIDFQIKTAILEESNRLRLTIEGWQGGQNRQAANANGAVPDASNDAAIPGDVLVVDPPGMETGSDANGHKASNQSTSNRRAKPRRPAGPGTIPGGNL